MLFHHILLGRNEILGDLLCLMAAILNAISLVAQEHIIKTRSITEYLGMLGMFSMCVSAAQL